MILLIDTSTSVCHLTVVHNEAEYSYEWQADREMAKGILSFIEASLLKHNQDWKNIESIGVLEGPGSYTGLRIGITIANAIAQSESIPIVGARGEDWRVQAIRKLALGENHKIVMPFYGQGANITKPRK